MIAVSHRTFWGALATGLVLTAVGLWGLDLQARQTRDTTRKLHLEALEGALLRLLAQTGTLPPAEAPTWCGLVNEPVATAVRADIERALRETEAYRKPEKPFPTDPRFGGSRRDYAYWKTSPVSFELLAYLEADDNNSRPLDLQQCALILDSPRGTDTYDYALVSVQRVPL